VSTYYITGHNARIGDPLSFQILRDYDTRSHFFFSRKKKKPFFFVISLFGRLAYPKLSHHHVNQVSRTLQRRYNFLVSRFDLMEILFFFDRNSNHPFLFHIIRTLIDKICACELWFVTFFFFFFSIYSHFSEFDKKRKSLLQLLANHFRFVVKISLIYLYFLRLNITYCIGAV
jgi:hypothetical protein